MAEDDVAEEHHQQVDQLVGEGEEQVSGLESPVAHHPPYSRSHRCRPALRPAPQLLNTHCRQRPGARRPWMARRKPIPKG